MDKLKRASLAWLKESVPCKYSYHFTWMGRPIIQYPQDIVAMQEIIWKVKPELIIETGIAHGGGLIFYASMLELIGGDGFALGIDIDIRQSNLDEIINHPMSRRVSLIQGSSVDASVIEQIEGIARGKYPVMVILDSNHTHEHVLNELELYSPLVTEGSYLVVCDTAIEDMPEMFYQNRPWGKGSNPRTAVWEFLKSNDRFEIDHEIEDKLAITVSPDGYLECIK